jgi:hypothetical protein
MTASTFSLKTELSGEVIRRKDLSQEISEEKFSQSSAQFRSPKNFLQGGDIPSHLVDLAISFLETPEAFLDSADDASCVVQSLA